MNAPLIVGNIGTGEVILVVLVVLVIFGWRIIKRITK